MILYTIILHILVYIQVIMDKISLWCKGFLLYTYLPTTLVGNWFYCKVEILYSYIVSYDTIYPCIHINL
jgi:hypothetical protein